MAGGPLASHADRVGCPVLRAFSFLSRQPRDSGLCLLSCGAVAVPEGRSTSELEMPSQVPAEGVESVAQGRSWPHTLSHLPCFHRPPGPRGPTRLPPAPWVCNFPPPSPGVRLRRDAGCGSGARQEGEHTLLTRGAASLGPRVVIDQAWPLPSREGLLRRPRDIGRSGSSKVSSARVSGSSFPIRHSPRLTVLSPLQLGAPTTQPGFGLGLSGCSQEPLGLSRWTLNGGFTALAAVPATALWLRSPCRCQGLARDTSLGGTANTLLWLPAHLARDPPRARSAPQHLSSLSPRSGGVPQEKGRGCLWEAWSMGGIRVAALRLAFSTLGQGPS